MENLSSTLRLIEFEIRDCRIAFPLGCVRRAVPSAEPMPLPGATDIVLGALNVGGDLVAVVDICRRLGLPGAPILPSQQLLIVELSGFLAGVLADRIVGVTERPLAEAVPSEVGGAPFLRGAVRLEDGLCLVLDPLHFLFPGECEALAQALTQVADGCH
jgi:chemotaxis signal transduction protein